MPTSNPSVAISHLPATLNDAACHRPIGIFDSGLGGLSVLQHIRNNLPSEHLLYVADSGFAPYGDKSEEAVLARCIAITEFLLERDIKALVVACNTATAVAINALRERYPQLLVVGVEPGLKPAATLSQSRIVGVLATERTLSSARFARLQTQISLDTDVRFLPQICRGLADQVEKGESRSAETALLVQRYVTPLIEQGADTLVLGCTHYPFVRAQIEAAVQRATVRPVTLIDTGAAVARQLMRLLTQHNLQCVYQEYPELDAFTSGNSTELGIGFRRLLGLFPRITPITAGPSQVIQPKS